MSRAADKPNVNLDDCVALLGVLRYVAAQLGNTAGNPLWVLTEEIALCDSCAQVSVLVSLRNK